MLWSKYTLWALWYYIGNMIYNIMLVPPCEPLVSILLVSTLLSPPHLSPSPCCFVCSVSVSVPVLVLVLVLSQRIDTILTARSSPPLSAPRLYLPSCSPLTSHLALVIVSVLVLSQRIATILTARFWPPRLMIPLPWNLSVGKPFNPLDMPRFNIPSWSTNYQRTLLIDSLTDYIFFCLEEHTHTPTYPLSLNNKYAFFIY